ncbi:MAG: pyruvate:ferredoxin (flavodoxin) oxidoreductase [Bacilli bacterium]|nr:pyruvate:ferredoxin (flavodoxin) oxidoreductase [Bacilli bacterium]
MINMKKIMDGNEACAYAAYPFTEVAGIYPITPASTMSEITDKWSSEGKKNFFGQPVKVVEMESEAGAIGLVHGSLQSGCLSSTYTASQGLLLMIPNMYKIAGQLFPCVINVAARSLATHALSIFGDHQDIYAVRQTGFAIMASSSVQECMDLTAVSYLSTIKGRVPFINFSDGFRTSHELQKIDVLDMEQVKTLIDKKALMDFRQRALNPEKPITRGTSQNEDIYFQVTEARNEYYNKLPKIVSDYMNEINKITGKNYQPFNYYGNSNATKIIVAMGSVCETIKETVDYLTKKGHNVGLLEVHLYRPFSTKYFLKALPKTVKKIAVLDRTKEAGSTGEPLYLDVLKTVKDVNDKIKVYGGRFGLSSKNTTPAMIKGVFDYLDLKDSHSNFTVGIEDDVTNLSIKYDPKFTLPTTNTGFLIYGYGSDGMVSASKDLMKITGTYTKAYVQGYFKYDSKKSGGITVSNLRFGKSPIKSTYYVEKASLIVCTKDTYLQKMHILDQIDNNGIFLLNTTKNKDEILRYLTNYDKNILKKKNIKFYIINASQIAKDNGIDGKISTIMETLIFKLGKIIDSEFAIKQIKDSIMVRFKSKGEEVVNKNIKVVDECLNKYEQVKIPDVTYVPEVNNEKDLFSIIERMEGENLPVSSFLKYVDGTLSPGTSRKEKRNISESCPKYNSENCIHCGLCSLVCPHAVVRSFLLNENEVLDAPESLNKKLADSLIKDKNYKCAIGISYPDCTGCGLCSNICPGKKGIKALTMVNKKDIEKQEYLESEYLFNEVSEKSDVDTNTVKTSQFRKPLFEFSGACSGCGETPYLKLLTQLFGDRLVIANATGCSSIYSASSPSSAYSVPWANSLFEDNAEFGFGMVIAEETVKNRIKNLITDNISQVKKSEEKVYKNYVKNTNIENAEALYNIVDNTKIEELKELKSFIKPKSIWAIGGDGWAYDIGYNGIDHVLSTKNNINILVLDSEVYSNTGGQASKSTRTGAIAKFAAAGKKEAKKDLAKIALCYPHVYVATISLGANPMQAIKVMKEAEAYNGPSIIIAYSPCIAQGIIKGMINSIEEEKQATQSGYFPIFHYNPEEEKFYLDSKADFSKYIEFLSGENRYRNLKNVSKDYKKILEQNKENAMKRYEFYEQLSNKKED